MAVETFNLWNRKAEQGPKPQFVAVDNSTPSTEDNAGSTKPKSKKRTSSPTATNQPRTIRPGILERLNLNSKITLRQAYQKPWLDAFDTNPNSIKFKDSNQQDKVIDFASKAIVSFPGSGLTTTLAAKALQLIREEEPVLILCEHDHSKQKIAQSILDLVEDPEEKQSIKSKLSFDHRGAKAITIVNPTVFQRKQSKTSEQVSNPVEALNPAIKHVLIDEANRYSGDPAEEQSRARIFTDILRQTNSSKDHPTHVYGVSSNPYYDSEDEVHGTRQEQVIEFYKIFLQANVSEGIAYPALKKQGFAREIKFNPIRIESDLKTNALRNVFQADHSNPALTSINNDSALVQLASRSEIKGKTRIMAHSVQSADDLAKIYCVLGKKAAVVTSKHKGFYELVESPQEDEINNLKQFQYNDKTYYLRKVIRDEAALLNGFEHGDIDFIIDYEILNGHDSPKVDNLVLFNASKWGPRMLKALGQSAIAPNQAKALNVYHCEFHNNGELKQDISALLNGILANSNPWDMFLTQVNTNPAASLGTTPAVINPAPSTLAIVNAANNSTILATDERWLEKGLKPIFALLNPRDLIQGEAEYLEKIHKHFGGKLDEDVLFGRKKDPEIFQKIIEFNFAILKKYSNASDNYSSLERYQSHLASIVPDLMKLEVDNHDFAVKLIADIYRNAPIKPDAAWLKRLDQLLKIHPSASAMDKKQLRSEKFAEVLYKLYGKEFFVFPANVKNAIEVFTGQTTNKFLLTYLLQSASSSSAEIEEIKQEFHQLFAKNSSRNFKSLQKQILSKFPEAPQAAQIKEFLTQTLYKELGIDLVTLINAAIIGASTDDQQIRSHSDLKQDLSVFLLKLEESLFAQEKALIEGDQFNQEIQKLVNEHIEPITQEIIFSQLMHKIWPDAAIRTTSHQSEYRSSDASPDTVTTSVKGIKADDRFEAIDLLQADKNWLKVISDQTNTVVDFQALSGYQIGIKARLMTAIDSFENSIDKSLTTREMKVLTGIVMPFDDTERNLVRSFLQFIRLDPKELVVQFPQRLGVTTVEEAQLLVAKALEGIKYRNKFTDATKNITLSADKLAEFFFRLSPELLLDREKLVIYIRELNDNNESTIDAAEKARRQDNLRDYICFCEAHYGEPKLADLVASFPLRFGLRFPDEFVKAFKANFDLTQAIAKTGNQNTLDQVEETAKKLGLTIEEMATMLGLPELNKFYRDAGEKLNSFDAQPFFKNAKDMSTTDPMYKTVLARNIIKEIYGDQYTQSGQKIFTESIRPLNGVITIRTKYDLNEFVYSQEETYQQFKSLKISTSISVIYEHDAWQLPKARHSVVGSSQDLQKLENDLAKTNPAWCSKIKQVCSGGIITSIANFLNAVDNPYKYMNEKIDFYGIAFGDLKRITTPETRKVFREWVKFLGMDLNEVVAEFPQLTGIQTREEAIVAMKKNFDIEQYIRTDKTLRFKFLKDFLTKKLGLADINELFALLGEALPKDFYADGLNKIIAASGFDVQSFFYKDPFWSNRALMMIPRILNPGHPDFFEQDGSMIRLRGSFGNSEIKLFEKEIVFEIPKNTQMVSYRTKFINGAWSPVTAATFNPPIDIEKQIAILLKNSGFLDQMAKCKDPSALNSLIFTTVSQLKLSHAIKLSQEAFLKVLGIPDSFTSKLATAVNQDPIKFRELLLTVMTNTINFKSNNNDPVSASTKSGPEADGSRYFANVFSCGIIDANGETILEVPFNPLPLS